MVHLKIPTRVRPDACRFAAASAAPPAGVGDLRRSATQVFCESDLMKLYPDDWRVRLTGAAGALVAGVIALFVVKPMIELPSGLGAFAFAGMMTVGAVLGNIVGGRLFRPSCNSSPKPPS